MTEEEAEELLKQRDFIWVTSEKMSEAELKGAPEDARKFLECSRTIMSFKGEPNSEIVEALALWASKPREVIESVSVREVFKTMHSLLYGKSK